MADDIVTMARGTVAEIKDGETNQRAVVTTSGELLVKVNTAPATSGVLPAGENHIGAVGGQKSASTPVTFTRPADTTAYTAKDIIGVNLAITGATNASPIVITSATHGLADGDPVTIASVGGNTNANGNFYAKVTGYSTTTFALYSDKALTTPVAGNANFTSGGTVAKPLRFKNMARVNGGGGYLVKATVATDQTTNTESYRLHLYKTPPAGILDNAACTAPLYADIPNYVGTIDFPAAKTEGSGATSAYANVTGNIANSNLPMGFTCATGDVDLYALVETPNGFTPANAQGFTFKLLADQD